jgi:potassium efflux system protein
MLHTVAAAHPKALSAPAPLALCVGFSNDALEFELRVWTANFEDTDLLRSDLAMSVHAALRGAGPDMPHTRRGVAVSRVDVASWDSRPVPAVAGGTLPPARSI